MVLFSRMKEWSEVSKVDENDLDIKIKINSRVMEAETLRPQKWKLAMACIRDSEKTKLEPKASFK